MQCPVCESQNLVMSDRQGIEIDYCPKCRGVWLDRGELDKIIERSPQAQPQPTDRPAPREARPRDDYDRDHHHAPHHHKKRKSWLSEIFD